MQRQVAQRLVGPTQESPDGMALAFWRDLFVLLEGEAERLLRATVRGVVNPFALLHLQAQAWQAGMEFGDAAQPEEMGVEQMEVQVLAADRAVPIGQHRLPPLPYPYDALEPYIDEATMRLHHDKHHRAYVEGLNKAERMMEQARQTGNFDLLRTWERDAAFNGAGHYLHTIFWNVMKPGGGGEPTGRLAEQIARDFGSFARFHAQFSAAAEQVEGPGWAILVWAPRPHRLEILQAEKHQNLSQWDVIPLLVLDVWEHAYYLKYKTDRKAYIDAWWHVVNWDHVAERFGVAHRVEWAPY